MKKWILLIGVFFTFGFINIVYGETKQNQIETIVFMRHGEKPDLDFGQLNCQGLNRALALPKVLEAKYGKPDYIFAPHPYLKGFYYYVRALVTIEPTAINLKMPVNTEYQFFHDDKIANTLLSEKYHNKLLFVSWEHVYITFISKKIMTLLGRDEDSIPRWESSDYDSFYVFRIDWRGDRPKVNFSHERQNLNNQSKICPAGVSLSNAEHIFGTQTIILVPEIESSDSIANQVTCKGLNRALSLPKILSTRYPTINLFVLPAPSLKKNEKLFTMSNYLLALMTLEPTMIFGGALYIPVGQKRIDSVLDYLEDTAFVNHTVAITWPLGEIAKLARAIYSDNGGNPRDIPDPIPDKDTIYQITVSRFDDNKMPRFLQYQQNLNGVPDICRTR